jgi:phosphopantothenoylcysteine decarboxylase
MNILLGVTGSVATIKLPELHTALRPLGAIRVVATESAMNFIKRIRGYRFARRTLRSSEERMEPEIEYGWGLQNVEDINESVRRSGMFPAEIPVIGYSDEDEWLWETIGDKVLHIDLKDWADILVIAPLTANTLAKMANGLCDNLLTCICRAWRDKTIVLAPAMNTDMWNHPLTGQHLSDLQKHYMTRLRHPMQRLNVFVVDPVEKKLACGTTGIGAMASVDSIVQVVRSKAV